MKNTISKFICLIASLCLSSCTFIGPTFEKLNNEESVENIFFVFIFCAWIFATFLSFLGGLIGLFSSSDSEHLEIIGRKIYHRKGYYIEGGFSEAWLFFLAGGALLMGLWFGLSSLILLMYYIWYPFFGMKNYNMFIKTVSFITMFVGYAWIYLKYFIKFELFFKMLAIISAVIFLGDIAISLWNME